MQKTFTVQGNHDVFAVSVQKYGATIKQWDGDNALVDFTGKDSVETYYCNKLLEADATNKD